MSQVSLTVNGKAVSVDVEDRTLLSSVLRENLGLTGTHIGCDTSQCGACTVHLDGHVVKSCTVLAVQAAGSDVMTIEGLAPSYDPSGATLHPVQQAFSECHALQCGFCTPGMIMAVAGLLKDTPAPDEQQIIHGLEGNLCRCTGYVNIVKAVKQAASALRA
jgi:carbon-monoxide dehydrogenase small subunit